MQRNENFVVTLDEVWVYLSDCNKRDLFSIAPLTGIAVKMASFVVQKSLQRDS